MASTFLLTLAGGMMMVLSTGRADQIAWRFLRMVGILAFALACGCSVWSALRTEIEPPRAGSWVLGLAIASAVGAAAVVFLAPVAQRMPTAFRAICGISGMAAILAAALAATSTMSQDPPYRFATAATIASQTCGAFLIGSITISWLLGHAYLTATKMTIAPLRHFSRLLSLAVVLRIAFLLVSLAVAWWISADPVSGATGVQAPLIARLGHAWLILTLRIAVGLLSVGLFAYMVADCVRLRSTQSATGILYFGSVFAYVGELANLQLIAQYGWAL